MNALNTHYIAHRKGNRTQKFNAVFQVESFALLACL